MTAYTVIEKTVTQKVLFNADKEVKGFSVINEAGEEIAFCRDREKAEAIAADPFNGLPPADYYID